MACRKGYFGKAGTCSSTLESTAVVEPGVRHKGAGKFDSNSMAKEMAQEHKLDVVDGMSEVVF